MWRGVHHRSTRFGTHCGPDVLAAMRQCRHWSARPGQTACSGQDSSMMQPRGTCSPRGVPADRMLTSSQALVQATSTVVDSALQPCPGTERPMWWLHQRYAVLCALVLQPTGWPPGSPRAASPNDKAPHTVADREETDKDILGVGRTPQRRHQLSQVVQEHEAAAHACRVAGDTSDAQLVPAKHGPVTAVELLQVHLFRHRQLSPDGQPLLDRMRPMQAEQGRTSTCQGPTPA